MTGDMQALQALYETYLEKAKQLERDRKPGQGLFGFGSGPKDDPSHDRFSEDLKALLEDISAGGPTSAETRQMLEYIYRAPLENRWPLTAHWMMRAVQGHTVALIGRLDPADAEEMRKTFVKDYPRSERFPVQKQVIAALDKVRKGK